MGEMTRAEISLKIAEKLSKGNSPLIESYREEFKHLKRTQKEELPKPPNVACGENPNLRGASNLVKLIETKDKGRFIVANEPVKTGDVVLCESPVAACLLPNFFGSHCHHCFAK